MFAKLFGNCQLLLMLFPYIVQAGYIPQLSSANVVCAGGSQMASADQQDINLADGVCNVTITGIAQTKAVAVVCSGTMCFITGLTHRIGLVIYNLTPSAIGFKLSNSEITLTLAAQARGSWEYIHVFQSG